MYYYLELLPRLSWHDFSQNSNASSKTSGSQEPPPSRKGFWACGGRGPRSCRAPPALRRNSSRRTCTLYGGFGVSTEYFHCCFQVLAFRWIPPSKSRFFKSRSDQRINQKPRYLRSKHRQSHRREVTARLCVNTLRQRQKKKHFDSHFCLIFYFQHRMPF